MFTRKQSSIIRATAELLSILKEGKENYDGPLDMDEHRKAVRFYANKLDHYRLFTHDVDGQKMIVLSAAVYDEYGEQTNEFILGMLPAPKSITSLAYERLVCWIEMLIDTIFPSMIEWLE